MYDEDGDADWAGRSEPPLGDVGMSGAVDRQAAATTSWTQRTTDLIDSHETMFSCRCESQTTRCQQFDRSLEAAAAALSATVRAVSHAPALRCLQREAFDDGDRVVAQPGTMAARGTYRPLLDQLTSSFDAASSAEQHLQRLFDVGGPVAASLAVP